MPEETRRTHPDVAAGQATSSAAPRSAPQEETAAGPVYRSTPDLRSRFTYHAPKEGQPAKYEKLRIEFFHLASFIDQTVPIGREKALALTKLEEALMHANSGIARNE